MKYDPIVIDNKGKSRERASNSFLKLLNSALLNSPSKPAKMIMSEDDFKDIIDWVHNSSI